jgi:hypothetical protein
MAHSPLMLCAGDGWASKYREALGYSAAYVTTPARIPLTWWRIKTSARRIGIAVLVFRTPGHIELSLRNFSHDFEKFFTRVSLYRRIL